MLSRVAEALRPVPETSVWIGWRINRARPHLYQERSCVQVHRLTYGLARRNFQLHASLRTISYVTVHLE